MTVHRSVRLTCRPWPRSRRGRSAVAELKLRVAGRQRDGAGDRRADHRQAAIGRDVDCAVLHGVEQAQLLIGSDVQYAGVRPGDRLRAARGVCADRGDRSDRKECDTCETVAPARRPMRCGRRVMMCAPRGRTCVVQVPDARRARAPPLDQDQPNGLSNLWPSAPAWRGHSRNRAPSQDQEFAL